MRPQACLRDILSSPSSIPLKVAIHELGLLQVVRAYNHRPVLAMGGICLHVLNTAMLHVFVVSSSLRSSP